MRLSTIKSYKENSFYRVNVNENVSSANGLSCFMFLNRYMKQNAWLQKDNGDFEYLES